MNVSYFKFRGLAGGLWLGLVLAALLMGCGESKTAPEAKTAPKASTETIEPTVLQDGVPATPEAAVQYMVDGLRENRPEAVWESMPAGWQRDINRLVRDFAKKMDPQLWQQSFATWKKLARLLAEKKTAILQHPDLEALSPEQKQRLARHWDGLVELLTILVHSELADLEQLQTFDMGRFLEHTGGRWLSELAELSESLDQNTLAGMLGGLTPKTLEIEDGIAKMAWLAEGSSEPVSVFYLIRVDGRWVPSGWASAWEQVRAWRVNLAQLPEEAFQKQSAEKLHTLAKADRVLDALLATQSAEEFQQALADEVGEPAVKEWALVIRTLSGASYPQVAEPQSPHPKIPKTAADASTVTLLINGAGPDDEDRIFDAVQSALPGDVEVQFESMKNGLKVIVGPVSDLKVFEKRITLGTVTKADAQQRILSIDMKN